MKTLTILFESPNVFYAVIDGVNIRIDNPEILESEFYVSKIDNRFFECWNRKYLSNGDIFQVERFDYEEKTDYIPISRGFSYKKEGSDQIKQCDLVKDGIGYYDNGKVAILKLAKEEEPKEKLYTIDEVIHKLRLGLSEYGKKSGIAGYWVLEDNVYYILNKLKK